MLIYRYENSKGEGPYNTYWMWRAELLRAHSGYESVHKTPSVYEDFFRTPAAICRYGCPSREILEDWFEGFHQRLTEHGFKVMTYETEDYIEGRSGRQVAFVPPHHESQRAVALAVALAGADAVVE